jgi:hypothetical protein
MSRFISRLATAAATAVLVVAAAAVAPVTAPATAKTAIALPSGAGPNSIMRPSGRPNSAPGVVIMTRFTRPSSASGRDRGERIALPSGGPNAAFGVVSGANRGVRTGVIGGVGPVRGGVGPVRASMS